MATQLVERQDWTSVLTETHNANRGDRYLACYLFPNLKVMLPVQKLMEVMTKSVELITPIPHMSPWVMGVYNWRGDALWVLDIAHLFGLTPWYQQSVPTAHHNILIIRKDTQPNSELAQNCLGIVVTKVQDLKILDSQEVRPPSTALATPELAPFLQGYWLDEKGEMLACIDVDAIFSMIAK